MRHPLHATALLGLALTLGACGIGQAPEMTPIGQTEDGAQPILAGDRLDRLAAHHHGHAIDVLAVDRDDRRLLERHRLAVLHLVRDLRRVAGIEDFVIKTRNAPDQDRLVPGQQIEIGWLPEDCRALDA